MEGNAAADLGLDSALAGLGRQEILVVQLISAGGLPGPEQNWISFAGRILALAAHVIGDRFGERLQDMAMPERATREATLAKGACTSSVLLLGLVHTLPRFMFCGQRRAVLPQRGNMR